ncbi:MAG TPA: NAD(P)-dependent oxidoreductase, partial [Ignavibacteriaceae bacterium]
MKILIASSIHADAVEQLKQHHDVISAINAPTDELVAKVRDRELIIFRSGVSITTDVMSAAPNLKFLVRAGSGLDNLDVEYTVKNNIQLVRIPEPGAKAVAELSFAFMLMLSRNLLKADNEWRKGHWIKSEMNGYLLTGKVLGIVGAGNIGSRVGRMGAAWGMNVLGCVEFPSKEIENDLKAQGIKLTTCDEVIRNSDYISIHVPLTDKTRNMINANVLNRMKKGSYLMNLARG